jgi:hypothetical protein
MSTGAKRKEQSEVNTNFAQPLLDHEDITRLAHSYWEARQNVSPETDWFRAEAELRGRIAVSENG